jgi:transglutaminase-like putative cysteine protease
LADIAWVTDHPGLDRYLEDTEIIDWQTPAVHEKAVDLTRGIEGERQQIRALFDFVRDAIARLGDEDEGPIACRASHVLREGRGVGFARCHLLVALLRARGIPAAFGYQRVRRDPPEKGHVLHGFVAVYLADEARWAPLDPSADRGELSAVCDLDEPRWGRAPDPTEGEQTYDLLSARPHRAVLDVLSRAPDLERLFKALPDSIG